MDVVVPFQTFVFNYLENKHPLFYYDRMKKITYSLDKNIFKSKNFVENKY